MTATTTEREIVMALSPEAKKRKIEYNINYMADHTMRLPINLNYGNDADIIAYLKTVPNRQGLIKELLRTRMAEEGFTYDPDN